MRKWSSYQIYYIFLVFCWIQRRYQEFLGDILTLPRELFSVDYLRAFFEASKHYFLSNFSNVYRFLFELAISYVFLLSALDENVSLEISRQILTAFNGKLGILTNETSKIILNFVLDKVFAIILKNDSQNNSVYSILLLYRCNHVFLHLKNKLLVWHSNWSRFTRKRKTGKTLPMHWAEFH